MNDLQLELIKLIGNKKLSFGTIFLNEQGYECTFIKKLQKPHSPNRDYIHCMFQGLVTDLAYDANIMEIIGHPATLSDLHRFILNTYDFNHTEKYIDIVNRDSGDSVIEIQYDSSKDLLDQDEETLKQIIELVKSNSLSN